MSSHFLVGSIGGELYAFDMNAVREVAFIGELKKIRGSGRDVRGVLNWRGRFIPVIDGRLRFGVEQPMSLNDQLVIFEWDGVTVGLIVDQLQDVVDVNSVTVNYLETKLKPPLNTLVKGLFYWQGKLVHIIDMERVIYCPEEVTAYLLSEGIADQAEIDNLSDEERSELRKRAAILAAEKNRERTEVFDIQAGENSFILVETAKRKYLVELSAICEFVSAVEFNSLPFVSLPILGTFNLRGDVLTLVQLDKEQREEFKLIMVVDHKGNRCGIGIQAVRDILTIERHLFRPDLTDFSQCSIILGNEVVQLLDLGSLHSRRLAHV